MATGKALTASFPAAASWSAELKRLLPFAPLVAVVSWAYAEPLAQLARRWIAEPDYNHGFLVPAFSAYLLWSRRGMLPSADLKGSWWGLALLSVSIAMRLISSLFFYPTMEAPSLIPCLAGVALLVGGVPALCWAWPSILFLVFMMPLPGAVAGLFSHRLQRMATISSTWMLQLLGVPAVSHGNVIRLTEFDVGVVEACSGLRMLMLFLAITVGASFLISRPLWEKCLIAASALVIGVIANITRITLTALLYEYGDPDWARVVFHDLAGWLMMPVAMLLLAGEIWLLSRLLIVPEQTRPVVLVGDPTCSPPPRQK
jgi:exosortase